MTGITPRPELPRVTLLKSSKIDAWIDGASPCVENCQNQGGGDRSLAPQLRPWS